MGKVNWSRVVLGGLLAGVVIGTFSAVLIPMFAPQWRAALELLGGGPLGGDAAFIAGGTVVQFWAGITMIWLYAAIRPRYGAGLRTAVLAGAAFWLIMMIPTVSLVLLTNVTLGAILAIHLPYLLAYAVAAVAGAWVYQEPGAEPAERSSPVEPVHA